MGYKVLIVEDSTASREFIASILSQIEGTEVVCASSGFDALRKGGGCHLHKSGTLGPARRLHGMSRKGNADRNEGTTWLVPAVGVAGAA